MGIPKTPDQSPVVTCHAARPAPAHAETSQGPLARSLDDFETEQLARLLSKHNGNRREIAGALGISERTIYRKLKRFGLG
jgi:DNA-binding NtrC family response regulator